MKKRLFLPLCITFLLLAAAGFFIHRNIDSFLFHRIGRQFFVSTLENDALTLHYTLADPQAYGIRTRNTGLPVFSPHNHSRSLARTQRLYRNLLSLRTERLSETDRRDHALLSSYIKDSLEGEAYLYYEEPLSPSAGIHTELLLLLAEYTFRTKEDVENYLQLLSSVPDYLEGLVLYEQQKAQAGLFMPKEDAQETARQCQQLFLTRDLEQNTHLLQTTFARRLESLFSTEEENPLKSGYIQRNLEILTTAVAPAYQHLAQALKELIPQSTPKGGLALLPQGKDYYAWLLARSTGCSMPPEDLLELLKAMLHREYRRIAALTGQYTALTGTPPDFSCLSDSFPLTDSQQILSDLQKKTAADFPSLSVLSPEPVSCTVRQVDASLEAFTSPAYYMTPPLDNCTQNTICINSSTTAPGVELYTTLAHEGYPGHLYQNVYTALSAARTDYPVRELLYYGGYTEGWAYYAERLSYTWAAQILADTANLTPAAAELLCELAALHRDLQINLYCILDIALHYQGVSPEIIQKVLCSFGMEENTAVRVCDYLRTSPAVYQKYFTGYLEVLALQKKAQELWSTDYTALRFHTFFLENGPSDFAGLYRLLNQSSASSSILSR